MHAASATKWITAGILASLSSGSFAVDWKLLNPEARSKAYVDTSSLKIQPGWRLAWIKVDSPAQNIPPQLVVVDCANYLIAALSGGGAAGSTTVLRNVKNEPVSSTKPNLILDDTVREAVSNYVCAVK